MRDMADASVRPAAPQDAAAIARVQAAVWSACFAGVLPVEDLAAVGGADGVRSWRTAVQEPPSPRHRVLAALAGEELVGFVAIAPAGDPDLDPERDAEIQALCVALDRSGGGHGSRLVNASADVMRGNGVDRLHVWLTDRETELRRFLEKAGWEADGGRRGLDLRGDGAVLVEQVRLGAVIGDRS